MADITAITQAGSVKPYTTDYYGGIRLLKDSGFNLSGNKPPLNAVYDKIFGVFSQKTGISTTSKELTEDFLELNPKVEKSVNLYSALENTFSKPVYRDKVPIVDFLDDKIKDFVKERDSDGNNTLTRTEAAIPTSTFLQIDSNYDQTINRYEIKKNFYDDFKELNNMLDYFENNTGTIYDSYA